MKVIDTTEDFPLVSVVIPSYNRKDTIGKTIDSILAQKCNFNFEIIIGDDYSTDGTRELLLEYQCKYPNKIVLLFHEKNIGLSANWATAVLQSRGKYLANCDNDDYWHNPNKLQLQVDFMESHLEYGVCHTDYRTHNRNTDEIKEFRCANSTQKDISLLKSIMNGSFVCCNASVMYRKEILTQYVSLDDYIKYQFTLQDWNTWMLLAKYTPFYELHVSTSTFGIETESITRPKNIETLELRLKKERKCYKYVCEQLPLDFKYDEKEYSDYANNVLLNMAYKQRNFKLAKKYAYKLETNSLKTIVAKNKILFHLFIFLKKIYSKR